MRRKGGRQTSIPLIRRETGTRLSGLDFENTGSGRGLRVWKLTSHVTDSYEPKAKENVGGDVGWDGAG